MIDRINIRATDYERSKMDVDAVSAAYEAAHGITFGSDDPLLGGANGSTAGWGSIGVRNPSRDTEEPVVRPY